MTPAEKTERRRRVARECTARLSVASIPPPLPGFYVVGVAAPPARGAWHAKRSAKLRRTYGITIADFEAMLAEQGGVCAICRRSETVEWCGKPRALNVDHCHVTGVVRGLLCNFCNHALGAFDDDPARLRLAADYLEGATA